tara:strand:+ start:2052 stop:2441 length:390 start_codon:yes stop_codon:yes gene_type:complete
MDSASAMLHSAESGAMRGANYLRAHFQSRMVQVSLYSMILFYIVANPYLFDLVSSTLNSALKPAGLPTIGKSGQGIVIFHSFVFGLLLYVLTVYVFDPIMKMAHVVEGQNMKKNEGIARADRRRGSGKR